MKERVDNGALLLRLYHALRERGASVVANGNKLAWFRERGVELEISSEKVSELLRVAVISVEEIGLGIDSVYALALYMLAPEQTDVSLEAVFNGEVLRLRQLLLRTSELYSKTQTYSSAHFQNLLISIAEDIRVILLIIADRLYRLRTAARLSEDEQLALALEVYHLYAPIAHRLGLYTIKGELEDLSLKYRDRKTFDYIKRRLGETKEARDRYIHSFIEPIRQQLQAELSYPFEIKGRTKSISSIAGKLRKQRHWDDIYDLFAIRIIIDLPWEEERKVCWQVYSIITNRYTPNPERLKDWISIPKSNGYESLHTTVLGPENKWVEVQIRSKRMDEVAESGVAAHWKYKGIREPEGLEHFLSSVREMLELLRETSGDHSALLSPKELTLRGEEIYVFSPQGMVVKLPRGATLLDFAFAIHSKVGSTAIGGKVNGRNVSIKTQLHNGDVVEVMTSSQQTPKADWLSYVVSPRAKNRIRAFLRAEEEESLSLARELLRRRAKNRRITLEDAMVVRLYRAKGYKNQTELYRAIAEGKEDVKAFLDSYEALRQGIEEVSEQRHLLRPAADHYTAVEEAGPLVESKVGEIIFEGAGDLKGLAYQLAPCCKPIYGDEIFAYVSSGGIKIHRRDCPNAPSMYQQSIHRLLSCRWADTAEGRYAAAIEVVGKDDIGIIANISNLISGNKELSIRSYSIESQDGLFSAHFNLMVDNRQGLSALIRKIEAIPGVKSCQRR